jgi:hypothetical protein
MLYEVDLILGEAFMHKYDCILHYGKGCIMIRKGKRHVTMNSPALPRVEAASLIWWMLGHLSTSLSIIKGSRRLVRSKRNTEVLRVAYENTYMDRREAYKSLKAARCMV